MSTGRARRADPPERRAFSVLTASASWVTGCPSTRATMADVLVRRLAPRFAPRVLRRCRAGRRDGRTRARAPRRAGLRPQADRPQRPRRPRPRAARRDLRRVEEDVPKGELLVLSAHGVAPAVRAAAARARPARRSTRPARSSRRCTPRPAGTRPLGYTVVLVGHAGHEEVEGTLGEAPGATVLVADGRGCRAHPRARPGPGRLRHPDDPLGRRDGGDRRRAPPPLSGDRRAPGAATSATRRRTGSGR